MANNGITRGCGTPSADEEQRQGFAPKTVRFIPGGVMFTLWNGDECGLANDAAWQLGIDILRAVLDGEGEQRERWTGTGVEDQWNRQIQHRKALLLEFCDKAGALESIDVGVAG